MKRLGKILMTPWFFRRLALIWACCMASYIVFMTFGKLELIDAARGTLLGTFFGALGLMIRFYHTDRAADARKGAEPVVQSDEPDEIV